MKKSKGNPKKGGQDYFPDIKKIEKKLQTEDGKKMLEVPDDISENKAYPISPEELPEPKEENEIP